LSRPAARGRIDPGRPGAGRLGGPEAGPVATRGLTHIALAVRDPRRSLRFYEAVLGVRQVYEEAGFIQAQTPGSWDVLVFERKRLQAGRHGGVLHFGFRLRRERDIDHAAQAIERAGGRVLARGEFCPGEPYVFFADPDGYQVELWYETPTPVDPRRPRREAKRPRRA
jgi:catechol 2,3-dioxygenase-like lactoylglutathione lyase family enzyme